MVIKKISSRDIPVEKLIELERLAGDVDITEYMSKHYGATRMSEIDVELYAYNEVIYYRVWGFTDVEKYTEFCIKWM